MDHDDPSLANCGCHTFLHRGLRHARRARIPSRQGYGTRESRAVEFNLQFCVINSKRHLIGRHSMLIDFDADSYLWRADKLLSR